MVDSARLARLEHVARSSEAEASRLLDIGMAPYVGDQHAAKDLKERMKDWLVQTTIRADPQIKQAIIGKSRKPRHE